MKEGKKTTICPRAPNAATRRSYSVALLYAVFLSSCHAVSLTHTNKSNKLGGRVSCRGGVPEARATVLPVYGQQQQQQQQQQQTNHSARLAQNNLD